MRITLARVVVVCTAMGVAPAAAWAQGNSGHDSHDRKPPVATDAAVDFGVLPTGPLGPPPCLQTTGIGGPADPCAYQLHHLTPEEVTIRKGGQVSFQIHGGGHGFAIYPVSKNTTREDLGQFLCAGMDPATITDPTQHPCNLLASNADAAHTVLDGKNRVVIVAEANVTNTHPNNRVWSEEDRLMSAGAFQ